MSVLLLRTTDAKGGAHGGFLWHREVGAVVVAPDWDPSPSCGGGLHGLLWGEGDGSLLNWASDALWWVVEADEWVVIDSAKAKAPRVTVRCVGTRREATDYLLAHGAAGRAVVGGTTTAGYGGTATAGYGGTLCLRWWDGSRLRLAVAYVGEDGIEPGVAYRCDGGKFVRVEVAR